MLICYSQNAMCSNEWKNLRRQSYSLIFAALQVPMLACLPPHHRLSGSLLCKESKETSALDVDTWRLFDTSGSHCKDADWPCTSTSIVIHNRELCFCVLLWSESGAVVTSRLPVLWPCGFSAIESVEIAHIPFPGKDRILWPKSRPSTCFHQEGSLGPGCQRIVVES